MIVYEAERSRQTGYLYRQRDTDLSFPLHLHSSLEFLYVEEGRMRCTILHRSYALCAGEGILLMPDQPHSYETEGHSRSSLWIFSEDWVPDFVQSMQGYGFERPVIRMEQMRIADRMLEEGGNASLHRAALCWLCGSVQEQCEKVATPATERQLPAAIVAYVQAHYTEEMTLHTLAKDLGYNYTYLSAAFNRLFGMGFGEFVGRFRVEHGARLLRGTRLPVTQIAGQCGFGSLRSFNRVFLARMGMTPTAYRAGTEHNGAKRL